MACLSGKGHGIVFLLVLISVFRRFNSDIELYILCILSILCTLFILCNRLPERRKKGERMRWFWLPLTMAALGLALELGPGPTGSKQNPLSKGRAAFPTCEAAAQSCTTHFPDRTSYPNIASGHT